jgi:hypothetical protein
MRGYGFGRYQRFKANVPRDELGDDIVDVQSKIFALDYVPEQTTVNTDLSVHNLSESE